MTRVDQPLVDPRAAVVGEPAHSPPVRPAQFALRSAEVFLRVAVAVAAPLRPVSDHRHLQCHAVLAVFVQQRAKAVAVRRVAAVPLRVRARQAQPPLPRAESPGREAAQCPWQAPRSVQSARRATGIDLQVLPKRSACCFAAALRRARFQKSEPTHPDPALRGQPVIVGQPMASMLVLQGM